jgi:CRISPR-associated protein Cmr3
MSQLLFMQPSDVWLFGTGTAFESGEDHRMSSMFPPTGQTMQGAVRSKLLAHSGVSLQAFKQRDASCAAIAQKIGWPGEPGYGALQLAGPWLARQDEAGTPIVFYPLPSDVVKLQDDCPVLAPIESVPFHNNAPEGILPLGLPGTDRFLETQGWLSAAAMEKYLKRQPLTTLDVASDAELFVRETHFGVKVDSSVKRPEEGHLFSQEYIRLRESVGLVVKIDGVELPGARGLLALGGGARAARYQAVKKIQAVSLPASLPLRFKIVLVTPAFFETGWKPEKWSNWFSGSKVRLVSAIMRRAVMLGGRDVAHNRPRPMRRYVSAGSVYFFEAEGPVTYSGQPITDARAEIGFGQTLIGGWDYV